MFKLSDFVSAGCLSRSLTPIEIIALSCVLIVVKAPVSERLKGGKVKSSILINTR